MDVRTKLDFSFQGLADLVNVWFFIKANPGLGVRLSLLKMVDHLHPSALISLTADAPSSHSFG